MKSEVVGVDLLVNETKENLIWLTETFARKNDMVKLRVVMADKDINERNRISDILGVPKMKSFCQPQLNRKYLESLSYKKCIHFPRNLESSA